jgi:hypothetical protein
MIAVNEKRGLRHGPSVAALLSGYRGIALRRKGAHVAKWPTSCSRSTTTSLSCY